MTISYPVPQTVAVIGGGAWGTALVQVCRRSQRKVILWARDAEVVEAVNAHHENALFLPGVMLDADIRATGDMAEATAKAEAVLLVAPAQYCGAVARTLSVSLAEGVPVVACAKGIELGTCRLLGEVLAEALPGRPLAVLSGPTFAIEVAHGQPTAVTLACTDAALGTALVTCLGSRAFRPYASDDVVGAEIGGAVKNVLAIACGIVEGYALGDNARAALITRGLAEMTRLGVALGGRAETLAGLSGLGDLVLTCTGHQSRNMSLGLALGQGQALADILAGRRAVTEGVSTAAAVVGLAARLGVDMPIVAAVDAILNRDAPIGETITALLSRPFRGEVG